ncbi:3071_t:CDS:2, partial [Dentiscutata heterogama]
YSLNSGNDIENTIKDIADTHVSNITPDRPDSTANPSQKLTVSQIREELIHHAQAREIENNKIPKEATIQNWISRFSCHWKEAIVLRALDKTENSEPS